MYRPELEASHRRSVPPLRIPDTSKKPRHSTTITAFFAGAGISDMRHISSGRGPQFRSVWADKKALTSWSHLRRRHASGAPQCAPARRGPSNKGGEAFAFPHRMSRGPLRLQSTAQLPLRGFQNTPRLFPCYDANSKTQVIVLCCPHAVWAEPAGRESHERDGRCTATANRISTTENRSRKRISAWFSISSSGQRLFFS